MLDTEQHIFKPWAGYALKSSLSIVHICVVTPAVGGAAVTMATLLDAETHPLCLYMPLSWPAQVRHAHLCVCAHLGLRIGG